MQYVGKVSVRVAVAAVAIGWALAASPLWAQSGQFTEVADEVGLDYTHGWEGEFPVGEGHERDLIPGAAAADYDNDGWIDLFLTSGYMHPNKLYRNVNGSFVDVTPASIEMTEEESCMGLFFDMDGDNDLDLIVNVNAAPTDPLPTEVQPRLFRNDTPAGQGSNPVFTDITATSGIGPRSYQSPNSAKDINAGSIGAADVDHDGDVDLYLCYWRHSDQLLLNNGDGTFTDVTEEAGVYDDTDDSWQVLFHDFTGDGLVDFFVSIDFTANRLYRNDGVSGGIPRFTNIAPDVGIAYTDDFAEPTPFNEMGASLGDFDNDGDLDVYVANIETPIYGSPLNKWNELFVNCTENSNDTCDDSDGSLHFEERAQDQGVSTGRYSWGVAFLDYDNDGWLDVAAVNGRAYSPNVNYRTDDSRLWRNCGEVCDAGSAPDAWFEDVSAETGFDDQRSARPVISCDFDRDGDLDVLVANYYKPEEAGSGDPILLRNNGTANNHWVVVDPFDPDSQNHRSIGALVYVTVSAREQMRIISAGTSFLGQEPDEAFFGTGPATTVDSIRVVWPDGEEKQFCSVAADQRISVNKGPIVATEITVDGPTILEAGESAIYTATAVMDTFCQQSVSGTATWSIDPPGFATIDANGMVTVGELTEQQQITIIAEQDGVEGALAVTLVTEVVDVEVPIVTITSPTTGPQYVTVNETVDVAGTAADNVSVASVAWSSNAGNGGTCSGTTSWSCTGIALVDGDNVITVSATDGDGNVGTAQVTVTLTDTALPVIEVSTAVLDLGETSASESFGVSNQNDGRMDYEVTADSDWVTVDPATGTSNGPDDVQSHTVTVDRSGFAPGQTRSALLTVTCTNATAPTVTIAVSATKSDEPSDNVPVLTITNPTTEPTYVSEEAVVTVLGEVSGGTLPISITWDSEEGASGTAYGWPAWTTGPIDLVEGENHIVVTALDAAGESDTAELVVTYEGDGTVINNPPVLMITGPTTAATYASNVSTVTLSGTVLDGVGTVGVTWFNDRGGSGVASGQPDWVAGPITLLQGDNVITATAIDQQASMSTDQIVVTYTPSVEPVDNDNDGGVVVEPGPATPLCGAASVAGLASMWLGLCVMRMAWARGRRRA